MNTTNNKCKKEYQIVKGNWEFYMEPQFFLHVTCPQCKKTLSDYNLKVFEGERINKIVTCPLCNIKFKLKVKEQEY